MKVISFLILCSVIIYINTQAKTCFSKGEANSSIDCKDMSVIKDGNHCCYLKASSKVGGEKYEASGCWEITQEEYDKIDDTIKKLVEEMEKTGDSVKIETLDCKSSYIVLSLFSLLLLLL